MQKLKIALCIVLSLALLAISGCGTSPDEGAGKTTTTTTTTDATTTTTAAESGDTTTTTEPATTTESGDTTTTTTAPTESEIAPTTTTTTAAVAVPGESIAFQKTAHFSLKYYDEYVRYENGPSFVGQLILDKKQYNALDWEGMLSARSIDTSAYTESYFTDKALIAIYVTAHSCSYEIQIDAVKKDGDTLTICYTEKQCEVFADMTGHWCILIEVDAASVKDATKIERSVTEIVQS